MKISVYIATSLDGYIARPDGNIEWLAYTNDKEDYGYDDFISGIDCIVMGRNTFEKVLTFSEWPYNKPVFVMSSTWKTIPDQCVGKIKLFSGSIDELITELKSYKYGRIYIDGGKTIQSFLRNGYVTDMTLTQIPILIGMGIPLFGSLDKDIKLKHIETKSFSSGLIQSKYEILA